MERLGREGPLMGSQAHLSVKQRVDQMIISAKQQFDCSLSINQSNRSAEQAQQFHICHMFLHNFFKHLRPKHLAADRRTINWVHLRDPSVNWALIPEPEKLFLYTKKPQASAEGGWPRSLDRRARAG
jgi:hypothetical protein